MTDDGLEPFEISSRPPADVEPLAEPEPAPVMKGSTVADKRYLCVTVVDHAAVIESTGEESYINVRIPVNLAAAGLKMVPDGKLGRIDPELIVEMIEEGATGTLVNINEEKKSISIRVE
jgi:hypothetical protein